MAFHALAVKRTAMHTWFGLFLRDLLGPSGEGAASCAVSAEPDGSDEVEEAGEASSA